MYNMDDNVIGEEILRYKFSFSEYANGCCYVVNFNECHDINNNKFYLLLLDRNNNVGIVSQEKPYRLTVEYEEKDKSNFGKKWHYYIKTFRSIDEIREEINKIESFRWYCDFNNYIVENYILYTLSDTQNYNYTNNYIYES